MAKRTVSLETHSVRECVRRDPGLAALRAEYARASPKKRRQAAEWEYDSAIASSIFNELLVQTGQPESHEQPWPEGVVAFAIDSSFAPAILTVGSIEYRLGREHEAMSLFMSLTAFPESEPDLPEIIDKAGDFLSDQGDYERARDLYAAAEHAFPRVAVYPAGLSYCLGKLGLLEEAIVKARRADELEPDNYLQLNDLGWSLYEAGHLDEAEEVLQRAVELSPEDYELARGNLQFVRNASPRGRASTRGPAGTSGKPPAERGQRLKRKPRRKRL